MHVAGVPGGPIVVRRVTIEVDVVGSCVLIVIRGKEKQAQNKRALVVYEHCVLIVQKKTCT